MSRVGDSAFEYLAWYLNSVEAAVSAFLRLRRINNLRVFKTA